MDIKVSVCVVTYNHEKYIAECLQSLVEQETDFSFEIIVGEDCSTDSTRSIIDEFAFRYPDIIVKNYHENNIGPTRNVLSTYQLARGQYIAHMDGDDKALPGKLKSQVEFLDAHPDCNIVWSRMKILDSTTLILHDDSISNSDVLNMKYKQEDLILLGSVACHSSKMFRKNTLLSLNKPEGEIYDFILDVEQLKNGYAKIIPSFLGVYRAGVGVSRIAPYNSLYISNLQFLFESYPNYRSELSARFGVLLLRSVKRKKFDALLLKLFFKSLHLTTFSKMLKSIYFSRFFRSSI